MNAASIGCDDSDVLHGSDGLRITLRSAKDTAASSANAASIGCDLRDVRSNDSLMSVLRTGAGTKAALANAVLSGGDARSLRESNSSLTATFTSKEASESRALLGPELTNVGSGMKNGGSKQIVVRSKEIFERFKAPVLAAFPDAKLKALHENMVSLLNQDEANASKLLVRGQQLFGCSSAQFHKVLYIQNPKQVVDGEVNKLVLVVLEALPLSDSKAKEVLRGRLITNCRAGLHMTLARVPEIGRAAAATAMKGRLQHALDPSSGYFDTQVLESESEYKVGRLTGQIATYVAGDLKKTAVKRNLQSKQNPGKPAAKKSRVTKSKTAEQAKRQ